MAKPPRTHTRLKRSQPDVVSSDITVWNRLNEQSQGICLQRHMQVTEQRHQRLFMNMPLSVDERRTNPCVLPRENCTWRPSPRQELESPFTIDELKKALTQLKPPRQQFLMKSRPTSLNNSPHCYRLSFSLS